MSMKASKVSIKSPEEEEKELEQLLAELTLEELRLEECLKEALKESAEVTAQSLENELKETEAKANSNSIDSNSEEEKALLEETRQYYTLLATREYYSPSSSTLTSTASTSTQTPFTAPLLLPTPLLHLESSQTLATTIKELTHSLSSSASESTSLQAQLKADLSLLSDAERIRRGLIERKGKENARMVVEGGEGVIRRMEEKARREKEGREKVLQDLVWFLEALAGDEDVNECVYDDDVPEFDTTIGPELKTQVNLKAYFQSVREANESRMELDSGSDSDNGVEKEEVDKREGPEIFIDFLEKLIEEFLTEPLPPSISPSSPLTSTSHSAVLPISTNSTAPNGKNKKLKPVPKEILEFLFNAGILIDHPSEAGKVRLRDFTDETE